MSVMKALSQVMERHTVYWVVVVPLVSLAVHKDHDVGKIIVVINHVSEKLFRTYDTYLQWVELTLGIPLPRAPCF
jgi:hypothetical protein